VAKQMRNAKRANRPNPREDRQDRNVHYLTTPITEDTTRRKKVQLLPRNIAQERYIDLLQDERKSIVFATGPAGTGKTLLASVCYPTVSAWKNQKDHRYSSCRVG
jgi:phosphate starvation-inducible protein PhoH